MSPKEALHRVRVFVANFENVVNKAKLIDKEIHKTGLKVTAKAIIVLVEYLESMERLMYKISEAI